MLKHLQKALFLSALLTVGVLYASNVEFTYNLSALGATSQSLVMGRAAGASDGIDELDSPWPPNAPTGGSNINYYYFLAGGDNSSTGEYMTVLSQDFRSSANKASTWTLVVGSMAGSSLTLNWTAEQGKALASKDGSLSLADANGTTLVANMLTTTSYNFTATGTYYIYYKDTGTTGTAPATPTPITRETVFVAGNVLSIPTTEAGLDDSITACNVDSVTFMKAGNASAEATTTTVTVDGDITAFTVTFGDDVPGDATSLVALYTVSNANGSAQGRITLVPVTADLELATATVAGTAVDLTENKVTIDFTDDTKTAYQTATFTYSFANSTAGAITSFTIALPNEATNWEYAPTEGVSAEGNVLTVTGVAAPDPGMVADFFTLTLTPKCGDGFSPKSGALTASITFTPEVGEAVTTASTVNLSVKTAGTLDVDGDEEMTLDDVILINAFVTLYPFLGDDITPEDVTEGLSGKDGDACLDALKNLWSSSAIDIDEDGEITLDDVIMINAFVTLYPFLGDDITPEDVTEGLSGKDGDVCLANLKALVP